MNLKVFSLSSKVKNSDFLNKVIVFLLFCLAVVIPYRTPSENIILLLFLVWIARIIIGKVHFNKDYVTISVLIFIGIIILSLFFPWNIYSSWDISKVSKLLIPLFLFLIVSTTIIDEQDLKKITFLSMFSFIILLGYLLLLHFQVPYSQSNRLTFYGYYANPFGGLITLFLLLSISLLGYYQGLWKTVLLSFSILISLTGLLFTYSRGSWLGFLSGLAWILWSSTKNKKCKFGLLVLCLVILITFVFNPSMMERFKSIFDLQENKVRFDIWDSALQFIWKSPIFGHGLGSFDTLFQKFSPSYSYYQKAFVHTHNNLLQLGVEFGLVGLFAFCWMVFAFLKKAFWLSKNSITPFQKYLSIATISMFISWFVNGLFDYSFKCRPQLNITVLILASLIAISQQTMKINDKNGDKTKEECK